ncbi:VWA domain-containing protein [Candidatus Magnetominusculus xianensis]|uniref:VWA domain-containing protein n=1 Tax=Candidatus Magnetominusculus xianensis TaxID=1748249 RepID=A0ABR5SGQ2_9BACT|nr:VWA domain-containing protein [Candidatus Magnetominusculus xianensis]KWT84928.1 VWA domain-containing protein [Candidatus Magnetominusculus xianensis]MBF0404490.1 VWA domain-containing protein [Nitrospirota bacterium]
MGGIRPVGAVSCLIYLILFILLPSPLPSPVLSAETGGFRVEQAAVELPNIKVYAEMPGITADIAATDNKTTDNDTGQTVKYQITGSIGSAQTLTAEIRPFAQSGEGVGYVFLVDISKSLKPQQFDHMREAVSALIGNMAQKDMAALITFGKDVKVVCDYTADKNELKSKINALRPVDDMTQLHRGLTMAVEMGRRKDASLPARKVIITLSDGEDDFAGGMTKDEVIDLLKVDRIPIYAIGFFNPPPTPKKDEHLKMLGEFARRSGGELIMANTMPYNEIYTTLNSRIRNSFIINLTCDNCTGDGQVSRLQLTLTAGKKQITDGMDIRILPRVKAAPSAAPVPAPSAQSQTAQITATLLYLISGLTIAVVLIMIIAMRRKKRLRQQNNAVKAKYAGAQRFNGKQHEPPPVHQRGITIKFTDILNSRIYEAVLDKPIVMGRNKAYCAVTIADDIEVSGVHCEISRGGGRFYIKDLGSTNGTLVNGVSLTSVQKIDDGDTITLGQTELRVSLPPEK